MPLNLFHVLNFVLLSDCLSEATEDFQIISENVMGRIDFYTNCSAYVADHFDSVYAAQFLKSHQNS
jgi:hypothetical protein